MPGAHQLPEPTTQTFLPPMVPGAGRCGLEPASAISGLPGAGAAPARPRPRLAAGPRAPLRARQVQSAALEQLRSPRITEGMQYPELEGTLKDWGAKPWP